MARLNMSEAASRPEDGPGGVVTHPATASSEAITRSGRRARDICEWILEVREAIRLDLGSRGTTSTVPISSVHVCSLLRPPWGCLDRMAEGVHAQRVQVGRRLPRDRGRLGPAQERIRDGQNAG